MLKKVSYLSLCLGLALASQSAVATIDSKRDFDRLLKGQSSVRVIVQLNVPKAAQSQAEQSQAEQSQSDRIGGGKWINLNRYISEAQQKLSREMGWRNINDIVNFEQVPAVAKSISPQEFKKLQRSGTVAAIFEDRFNPLQLTKSRRAIGANQTSRQASDGLETGGEGVGVAVLDTGVEYSHDFFQGRVVDGACYSAYGSCENGTKVASGKQAAIPCRIDGCDHGTHVAGIIAGRNSRMSGVAPDAHILALNVFSNDGSRMGAYDSDIIQGLEWVYKRTEQYNIAAVNMSLGGGYAKGYCDNYPAKYIIDKLYQKDVLTVVASGNDGYTDGVGAPSCISTAMSVGSTDKDGKIARYSNSYPKLDIVAPGSDIVSSVTNNDFEAMSGTSMAAPHVAGAVAVLKSAYPKASARDIRQALAAGKPFRDPRNRVNSAFLYLPNSLAWLEQNLMQEEPPVSEPAPKKPEPTRPTPTKPAPKKPEPSPPKPTPEKPAPKEPPKKDECKKRIDGILVEKTTGDCAKKGKIKW